MNNLPPRSIWVVTNKPRMFPKDYIRLVSALELYREYMGSCFVCSNPLDPEISMCPETVDSLKMLELSGRSMKVQAGWMYTTTLHPYEGWIWDPICAHCLLDNIGKPDIRAFTYGMTSIYEKRPCLYV